MKILLDTQVFIWLVNDDPRLGSTSKRAALSTKNTLYISFLAFFEMTIKASLGKLTFDPSIMQDLDKVGVHLVAGDYTTLAQYRVFYEQNKDPFDNFFIATAKANNFTLLTSDHKILQVQDRGCKVLNAAL